MPVEFDHEKLPSVPETQDYVWEPTTDLGSETASRPRGVKIASEQPGGSGAVAGNERKMVIWLLDERSDIWEQMRKKEKEEEEHKEKEKEEKRKREAQEEQREEDEKVTDWDVSFMTQNGRKFPP
jgi:hypothetical protein